MSAAPQDLALRRLPLPDTSPPLEAVPDDGPPHLTDWAQGAPVQGTLRLVVGDDPDDEDDFGPVPTSRADLPDPYRWSRRLVQVLVEVMSGNRAATQLLRWTSPEVYERVRVLTAPAPRATATGQLRSTVTGAGAGRRRPVVRSVRVCEPADGVAEVSAVVLTGQRAQALAVRLEGHDGRWRATALECG